MVITVLTLSQLSFSHMESRPTACSFWINMEKADSTESFELMRSGSLSIKSWTRRTLCIGFCAKALSQLKDVLEDFARNISENQLWRMARHTRHRAELCYAKQGCQFRASVLNIKWTGWKYVLRDFKFPTFAFACVCRFTLLHTNIRL